MKIFPVTGMRFSAREDIDKNACVGKDARCAGDVKAPADAQCKKRSVISAIRQ